MPVILTIAWKDLRRLSRDPIGYVAWLAIPLIVMSILSLVFGAGGPAPQGELLVVDQDNTLVSAALSESFRRAPLNKLVRVEPVEYAVGRKRIDEGGASALLIIPKGFANAFFRSEPAKVSLVTNPAQRILPRIIEESIAIVLEAGFYLQQYAGADLKLLANGPVDDQQLARSAIAFNRASQQILASLNPPLIGLETSVIEDKKQSVSFAALFYPGMLMLAIFGLAQSLGEDLWRERTFGTLRRLLATPRSIGQFIGGKIIAFALLFAAVGAAGIALASWAFSAPFAHAVWGVLWLVCSGLMLYLLTAVLISLSTEQRSAAILNFFLLFVLSMIGGSFFPSEVMPSWLAAIGRYTPNGWAISRFKEIVSGAASPLQTLAAFASALAVSALAMAILTRRLRRWAVR